MLHVDMLLRGITLVLSGAQSTNTLIKLFQVTNLLLVEAADTQDPNINHAKNKVGSRLLYSVTVAHAVAHLPTRAP